MGLGRTVLSATLAVSLAACGGGGNSSGGGGNTGTGGGTIADACSLASRQDWALQQLNEFYLFPTLLDQTVNRANYSTVQSYIDALVAPARAQQRDRFFTYITSIAEENALISSGSSAGFGIRLSYQQASQQVFVVEAFESAPALAEGIEAHIGGALRSRKVLASLWTGADPPPTR